MPPCFAGALDVVAEVTGFVALLLPVLFFELPQAAAVATTASTPAIATILRVFLTAIKSPPLRRIRLGVWIRAGRGCERSRQRQMRA
jgi:hypothetical protein